MMEAGRGLDALVAEKVMGWQWQQWAPNPEQPHLAPPGYGRPHPDHWWLGRSIFELVPNYSTDIAAAWLVVEHMERTRPNEFMLWTEQGQWGAEFDNDISRFALAAPLSICVAALAAVGVEYR